MDHNISLVFEFMLLLSKIPLSIFNWYQQMLLKCFFFTFYVDIKIKNFDSFCLQFIIQTELRIKAGLMML